jgi:hypothetical protein
MKQRTRPRAPVKPISGRCSWILQPGDGKHPHPGIISINGTAYSFEEVLDGLSLLGFRLRKKDGVCYDIDVSAGYGWTCDCPDGTYHPERPGGCKHAKAVKAALAFLGRPLPQPVIPTPLPIEPSDALPDALGVDGDPAAYHR